MLNLKKYRQENRLCSMSVSISIDWGDYGENVFLSLFDIRR